MRIGNLPSYRFRDLGELIRYFEGRLSLREIESTLLESGQTFVPGKGMGEEEIRLGFLARCHAALSGSFLLKPDG